MSKRFKFLHNGMDYEVLGSYGVSNIFIVTQFPPEAVRMLSAAGTPSGVSVKAQVAGIETQEELLAKLNNKYPGLTRFAPF